MARRSSAESWLTVILLPGTLVRLRGRATLSTARLRCQRLEKVPRARLVWRAHGEPLVGPRSRRAHRAPRAAPGRGPGAARLPLAGDRPPSASRAAPAP